MKKKEEKKKIIVPMDFRQWWEPWGIDKETGASIGGHQDSYRVWARKEPGRYFHRHYGINTESAWMTKYLRDEFQAWKEAGSPQREDDFVSLAETAETQKRFWRELKPIISKIAKPIPRVKLPDPNFRDPAVENAPVPSAGKSPVAG